ncbi:hypothetical protein ACTL6U_05330 [Rhodovibrionaceae bacterium A322]
MTDNLPDNQMEKPSKRFFEFFVNFVQVIPLILFVQTRDQDLSYLDRFTWGAIAAIVILLFLALVRRTPHPLWTAYDLWLILAAGLLHSGVPVLTGIMEFLRESSLFAFFALTILGYLLRSPRGFFHSCKDADPAKCRRYSLIFLGLTVVALGWSFSQQGDEMTAAVIPGILLGLVYLALERVVTPPTPLPPA